MNGPRVLVLAPSYPPAYRTGGPPQSIYRLIEREAAFDIRVVCPDRDVGDHQGFPTARVREWVELGNAQVAYLRPRLTDWPWVLKEIRAWAPDLVYLNGVHNFWFTLWPLALRRLGWFPRGRETMIAARGELADAALSSKSFKKRLAKPFMKALMGKRIAWHTASEDEALDVRRWLTRVPLPSDRLHIQSNVPPPPANHATPPPGGTPVLAFASRIDSMKGLDVLLTALIKVRLDVRVSVHGYVSSEAYWDQCMRIMERLPPNVRFEYRGEYRPCDASSILSAANLFVLPTRGESFGQAIAEALSVGCPILISDKTPWTEVVTATGWIASNPHQVRDAIEEFCRLDQDEQARLRKRTLSVYRDWYEAQASTKTLFGRVVRPS